jgi:hypothetical protein
MYTFIDSYRDQFLFLLFWHYIFSKSASDPNPNPDCNISWQSK